MKCSQLLLNPLWGGIYAENTMLQMNKLGQKRIPFLFVIDFMGRKSEIVPLDETLPKGIMFDVNGFSNCKAVKEVLPAPDFIWHSYPVSRDVYQNAFEAVRKHQIQGDSYLVNLTFSTPVETSLSFDEIFSSSKTPYRLLFKDQFVCFSPETFVTIKDGKINSHPMKGTAEADIYQAEKNLLDDEKELAEHITIVDLIRDDLSRVSTGVRVEKFRYLDRVHTHQGDLLQLSSRISGQLPDNYREQIGTLIFTLLPAGSVTGAPKKKTVEIILETENYNRGFYTGVFGYFDGENLDSAVMIRFLEKTDKGYIFKSGGGLTIYSDPVKEYEEMIRKVYVPFG